MENSRPGASEESIVKMNMVATCMEERLFYSALSAGNGHPFRKEKHNFLAYIYMHQTNIAI